MLSLGFFYIFLQNVSDEIAMSHLHILLWGHNAKPGQTASAGPPGIAQRWPRIFWPRNLRKSSILAGLCGPGGHIGSNGECRSPIETIILASEPSRCPRGAPKRSPGSIFHTPSMPKCCFPKKRLFCLNGLRKVLTSRCLAAQHRHHAARNGRPTPGV